MRLEVIPDLRFTCSECGDCCVGWNVMVTAEERESLEAADVEVDGQRVVELGDGRLRLARRADGACVFLGQRRQCRLHERLGAAAKPILCQLYPFSFHAKGERVGVDVAFSCRAVSLGQGGLVGERSGEWLRWLERPGRELEDRGRHRLTPRHAASPELLWEIERILVGFLLDPVPPLLDRMRAVLEFLRLGTAGDPATPQATLLRQAIVRTLPAQIARRPAEGTLDRTQRAVLRTWTWLALNPAPPDLGEWPAARQARERERRDARAQGFRDGRGRPQLDNRELDVTMDAIAAVAPGTLAAPEPGLLARFLAAKLVGQRYLRAGDDELSLAEAMPRLLLLHPVASWAARALAAERGLGAVGERELADALRLADRTVGSISLAGLPPRSRQAFEFVLDDTDLVIAAALEATRPAGPAS